MERIIGADAEAKRFLAEWDSTKDYIEAHTSGSTGAPKTIRLSKADMRVSAQATCRYFGIGAESHLVSPLSADYIAGKMMIVRAIESGADLTILPPTRKLQALGQIHRPIDLLPIVPAQIAGLIEQIPHVNIANVIVGGAPMTPEQEEAIAQAPVRAYATYGMTETCSHVALRHIGRESAYGAMPGITFSVDADDCLVIHAPGYSARQYATTDIVRLIDQSHFIWSGRKDHVINSGGIKIQPEEAEARLRPYFAGIDYYVCAQPSDRWGQEMVMVIANHGTPIDPTPNAARAAQELPHHLLPKRYIQVEEHQYTATGKLKRTHR